MSSREPSSLRSVVQESVRQLGAELLTADDERLVVGYQELELRLAWVRLQELLSTTPTSLWPETLAESLVEQAAEARSSEDEWPDLRERVWPVLISQQTGRAMLDRCPDIVAFPFAAALLIVVGYATGAGWRYLTMPQLPPWGIDGSALIAAAISNLRRDTPATCLQAVEPHHYALDTGDGYDSSRLLILDELMTEAPEAGALAVVPSREVLSFTPFNSHGAPNLRKLVNLAARCYATWPYPLDPGLFYVHRTGALHIPVTQDDDGAPRLHLPEELAEIQARLVQRGEW
jgi:hypothetical protein